MRSQWGTGLRSQELNFANFGTLSCVRCHHTTQRVVVCKMPPYNAGICGVMCHHTVQVAMCKMSPKYATSYV